MNKEKIKSLIFNILLVIVILIICFNVVITIMGIRVYAVKTGSMEPYIHQGSAAYVKSYKTSEIMNHIKVGDDITYLTKSKETVTHRIIFISDDLQSITTQGTREGAAVDAAINPSQIKGKVLFSIPLLGYLILLLKNKYVLMMLVLIAILVIVTQTIIKEYKKEKQKNVEKKL